MTDKSKELLLIGGSGRMGTMFHKRWAAAGYTPYSLDLEKNASGQSALSTKRLDHLLPKVQAVVLCVPCSALAELSQLLAAKLAPEQILLDITSVKTLPMQLMQAAYSGPVVGTHPLFGPEPGPDATRVTLVRGDNAADRHVAFVEKIFRDIGCEPFLATAEEHDAASARVQSLNFVSSAAYFATLAKYKGLERYLTPSFTRHLGAARKLLTKDAAMFCEFTEANPFFAEALKDFQETLSKAGKGELSDVSCRASSWYAQEPESWSAVERLHDVARAFRAWAAMQLARDREWTGWEIEYPNWDLIYPAADHFLDVVPYESWSPETRADLLYLLARDTDANWLARRIARQPELLLPLAAAAMGTGENNAKWQLASELGLLETHKAEAEALLLSLIDATDEYVSRMALIALGKIQSAEAERLAEKAYAQGVEWEVPWRCMAALSVLHAIHSGKLALYLERAQDEGDENLARYADACKKGDALPADGRGGR